MTSPWTILIATVLTYAIWNLHSLFANYRKARQSGFPVLVCPVNTDNVLWIIFSVKFRPILAQCLPSLVYDHLIPAIYGWEFWDRNRLFDRLGSSFILVTPGRNTLWVADPETAHSILTRRNDFPRDKLTKRRLRASKTTSADKTSRYHGYGWSKCYERKDIQNRLYDVADQLSPMEMTGNVKGRLSLLY